MAAEQAKKPKKPKKPKKQGGKKAIRGRMPSKQTINLILIDENKINPLHAILGVLLIVVLAGLFSKYLVADRLIAMNASAGRASQLKADLDKAMAAIDTFGDVETTYAHYTMAGMTQAELSLVDRARVLALVEKTLPETPSLEKMQRVTDRVNTQMHRYITGRLTLNEFNRALLKELWEVFPPQYTISSWSVSGNLMTMDVTGNTLRTLNNLARTIETDPIVDSCTIVTAKKDKLLEIGGVVDARFTVYLQQPPAEEEVAAP